MPRQSYHHGDLKNALVKAGAEILAAEGLGALSLRKVAARAGVTHSAPYAHFPDKQALIAAIVTAGFRQLHARLAAAVAAHSDDSSALLLAVARAYVQFALDNPAGFKLMFTGVLENESRYPELVEISKQNFALLVDVVTRGQAAGLLRPGPPTVLALSLWSLLHGFLGLLLERQISHTLLDAYPLDELLRHLLNQVTLAELAALPTR